MVGRTLDQHPLHISSRRTPDGETSIAVMVVMVLDEGSLAADEKRGRTMTRPLAGLMEREADLTKPCERAAAAC